MKNTFHATKNRLGALALMLPCAAATAHAATTTFASFSDTVTGKWVYSNGALTASADPASFTSFGGPSQMLNYTGPVTYSVNASAAGVASESAGVISQPMNGEIVFKEGGLTVLDVLFTGALISGKDGSNSSSVAADTTVTGNVISYSSDPSLQVASFVAPFSFSIALTQLPGISISGANLANFAAAASGSFAASSSPGGAGNSTPLPRAAASVPLFLAGMFVFGLHRRKAAR